MKKSKKLSRLFFNKITALAISGAMSFSTIAGLPAAADYDDDIAELERRQSALEDEREEIERNLASYDEGMREQEEYLELYDEKMKVQEQEINNIKEQISVLNGEIEELEVKIADKEKEVEEGISDFKLRLRTMYMNGSDSIASILTGSSDFFDILARMELVERVSRHDTELIDGLNEKISSLNSDKAALEETKIQTMQKKSDAEAVLENLQSTYKEHKETKEWYENQAAMDRARTKQIENEQAEAEEELQNYIRLKQEELERERKRKEEEERKRREEEERKRKEEEERRLQEEEQRRLEAEAQGVEYVPEVVEPLPEPESDDSYKYVTGASEGFIWPCPSVLNMTDGYGNRYIVEEGSNDFHKGIDITKPGCAGEPIVASGSGTVITASNTGNGYGIHVVIDHGDSIATLYGHMSSCCVSVGEEVSQGQTIGYIGCTGYAYGNHCHFEVRVNGQHTNPLNYVSMG